MPKRSFCFIFLTLTLALASGCATSRKDFKASKPGEATAIGRVQVTYNGRPANKDCRVCFNSSGVCQKLEDDGLVFISLPIKQTNLNRVECRDVSWQHYNVVGADMAIQDGVNYFGAVDIDWTNQGGFKSTDMFGAIGAAIAESKNDGTVRLKVSAGPMRQIVQEYEKQTGQTKTKVNTNLVTEVR